MSNLNGRYAIVTGGGKGLGAAIAKRFAEEQAAGIAILEYDLSLAEKTAAEIGGNVLPIQCDVSDEAQVKIAVEKVLAEFGLYGKKSVIVNGHMPVKVKDGEVPESANCRHITIDGGLSKAYQSKTGIGGYTLISNSEGMFLVSHSPDFSREDLLERLVDLKSEVRKLFDYDQRILVKQTDKGIVMQKQIEILKGMLKNYYKV